MKKKHIGSVLLGVWLGLTSVIQFWPDAMIQLWMAMPDDLKASLPPLAVKWITYGIMVVGGLAKLGALMNDKRKLKEKLNDVDKGV